MHQYRTQVFIHFNGNTDEGLNTQATINNYLKETLGSKNTLLPEEYVRPIY